jgi:hypothetical protein
MLQPAEQISLSMYDKKILTKKPLVYYTVYNSQSVARITVNFYAIVQNRANFLV